MLNYLDSLPNELQLVMVWPLVIFAYASNRRSAEPVAQLLLLLALLWLVCLSLPLWILNLPAFLIWKLFRMKRAMQKEMRASEISQEVARKRNHTASQPGNFQPSGE